MTTLLPQRCRHLLALVAGLARRLHLHRMRAQATRTPLVPVQHMLLLHGPVAVAANANAM